MDSFPNSVPSPSVSVANSEPVEDGERISRSPYTARLLGWSDEELASRDFFRLVEAIRWLTDAEESGALARRAGIYSAKDELVWARMFAPKDEQRERVMKYNAARILAHVDEAARGDGMDSDQLVQVYDSVPVADFGPNDDFIRFDK
jgi:hypothetical protein